MAKITSMRYNDKVADSAMVNDKYVFNRDFYTANIYDTTNTLNKSVVVEKFEPIASEEEPTYPGVVSCIYKNDKGDPFVFGSSQVAYDNFNLKPNQFVERVYDSNNIAPTSETSVFKLGPNVRDILNYYYISYNMDEFVNSDDYSYMTFSKYKPIDTIPDLRTRVTKRIITDTSLTSTYYNSSNITRTYYIIEIDNRFRNSALHLVYNIKKNEWGDERTAEYNGNTHINQMMKFGVKVDRPFGGDSLVGDGVINDVDILLPKGHKYYLRFSVEQGTSYFYTFNTWTPNVRECIEYFSNFQLY